MSHKLFLFFIFFTSSMSCSNARDYYIDPRGGNNKDSGDITSPLKSLDKVNNLVLAGDVVHLMPGEYHETISPKNSGSSKLSITYKSEERRRAVFRTTDRHLAIVLKHKNYIKIEGIKVISSSNNARWVKIVGTTGVSIVDSEMSGGKGKSPFVVKHSKMFKLYGNDFSDYTNNMLVLSDTEKVIVDGNRFTNGGHAMLMLYPSNTNKNIVIRNNIFHPKKGRGFAVFTSENVLFENNILMGSFNGAYSALPASKFLAVNGIFRHNKLVNNLGTPLVMTAYNKNLFVDHIRIYGNLFKDNYRAAVFINGSGSRTNDVVFQNNVFLGRNTRDSSSYVRMKEWELYNTRFIDNKFITSDSEPYYPIWLDGIKSTKDNFTLDELEDKYPNYFINNKVTLNYGSSFPPNNNQRSFSATATASGKGIRVPVSDTYSFYDGFDINGEMADSVIIGGTLVRLSDVDHSKGILVLEKEIRWNNKDEIYIFKEKLPVIKLNCNDKWRDITEFNEHCVINIGDTVEFKSNYNGGAFRLDIENETYHVKNHFKYTFSNAGLKSIRFVVNKNNDDVIYKTTYIHVVSHNNEPDDLVYTRFSDDKSSWESLWQLYRPKPAASKIEYDDDLNRNVLKVYAKSNNSKIPARFFPEDWSIDGYPYINVRYRIKNNTGLSICLIGFNVYNYYIERCLASNEENVKSSEHKLYDDEKWHELVIDVRSMKEHYPGIEHLRGIIIGAKYPKQVKSGMSYWLDELSVSNKNKYSVGL